MVLRQAPKAPDARMLAAIALGYGAAIAVSLLTRFGGGVACMWLATGVLGPVLARYPLAAWWRVAAVALPVSTLMTATLGLGVAAAPPLAFVNLAEAAILAFALRRFAPIGEGALRSIRHVAALILGGTLAAAATGPAGALVAAAATGTGFWANYGNWLAGHALGSAAMAPIVLLLLSGELALWAREAGRGERIEAGAHACFVTAVALATFGQSVMPLSFLPLLAVVLATFRLGRIGAAISTLILATIAIIFSIRGSGPVALMPPDPSLRIHLVQFYLATVVLTVLPAAADLRRRKDVFRRLAESEARYRLVTENTSDVVMTLDADGCIRFVSPSIEGLGDYRVSKLVGTIAMTLIAPQHRAIAARAHLEAMRRPGSLQVIEVQTAPDAGGGQRWIEMRARATTSGRGGGAIELVCAIRDISKRKSIESELQRAARTDPLTGLANRRLFNDALDLVIGRVARDEQARACIAVFDLDHFKRVNDGCGHDAGDRVLRRFAEVASAAVRPKDLVARLGGEEFGLVLPGTDIAEAERICERLRRSFAADPTRLDDGRLIWATVSAGIAAVASAKSRTDTMREADAALYAAKRAGRDRLIRAA